MIIDNDPSPYDAFKCNIENDDSFILINEANLKRVGLILFLVMSFFTMSYD